MSFGMNYEEDFKAASARFEAYREEARREWMIREMKASAGERTSGLPTNWNRVFELLKGHWLTNSEDSLPSRSTSGHRAAT